MDYKLKYLKYKKKYIDLKNNSIKNVYARIKPSTLGGVGVFAIRDINKDTLLFQNKYVNYGHFYSKNELSSIDKNVVDMMEDYWCYNNNKKVFIPDNPDILTPANFLNHSSTPNIKPFKNGYISTKFIKKGEELLEDYNEVCNGNHKLIS